MAMAVAASLAYPNFFTALGGEETVTILGLPVMSVAYKSTLLPALLTAVCAYYVEKLLVKIIPGILRQILLGLGTIAITFLGATAYVYGYSTILAIPIFQQTIMAIVAAIIVAILVAAAID